MKTNFIMVIVVLGIILVSGCITESVESNIPPKVLQKAIDKDPSAELFEISKNFEEERYTFVGEEVFQIIILDDSSFGFNTINHLSPKDFEKYKVLKKWNVDYNLAKSIAQRATEFFDGEFNELGYLKDSPIEKYCGGGEIPEPNPTVPHTNPYWTFSKVGNYRFYSVYIDAVDGEIIHSCKGYLK